MGDPGEESPKGRLHPPDGSDPKAGTLDATVVICAYTLDRWDDLKAAVSSVQRQIPGPREILVVIDHNSELLEAARGIADVRVVANRDAQGLSGARNTGVQDAVGEVTVFLDDDAVAAPDWLGSLCAPIVSGEAEVTGGRADAVFDDGRPGWFPEEFDWVVGCTYRGHLQEQGEIRNPIGCNMAFRARALEAAGPFRTDMGRIGGRPLGCEETELCIRLQQARPAARIVYVPSAVVTQRVPPPRATFRYFLQRCYSEGLSKAVVARFVGDRAALASERSYTRSTLPAGVVSGLVDTLRRHDPHGLTRSGAIIIGLGATGVGFLRGRAANLLDARGGHS